MINKKIEYLTFECGGGKGVAYFLWRNILLAACCLLLNCTLLNAQDIDYSKCSCDSLFKVIKIRYSEPYTDDYQGKRRYIDGMKCITATDLDSIIVRYETETIWTTKNDSVLSSLITVKTDSTVFHKKKENHFSEVELYQRKVSNLEAEYKYFKKDFGLELRLKVHKNIAGKDSAFYYYSEKSYGIVYEAGDGNKVPKISSIYLGSVPIKYTFTIDTNGYLNDRYIAYCPNGEKMTVQTFSHGVLNGYFYYSNVCKLNEDSYGDKLKKGKYFNPSCS
ncbi:MAG: hypothetical protein K0B10_15010 [Vicingaceae bacterium]|nr:hypothetical protein [Vicingaceae bacterium]